MSIYTYIYIYIYIFTCMHSMEMVGPREARADVRTIAITIAMIVYFIIVTVTTSSTITIITPAIPHKCYSGFCL